MLERLLSKREYQVLSLISDGFHNVDISVKLNVTSGTVSTHLSSVYAKLGLTHVYSTNLRRGAAIACFLQFSGVDNNTPSNSLNSPAEIDLSVKGVVTHFYIEVDVVDNVIVGGRVVEMVRGKIVNG